MFSRFETQLPFAMPGVAMSIDDEILAQLLKSIAKSLEDEAYTSLDTEVVCNACEHLFMSLALTTSRINVEPLVAGAI